MSVVTISLDEYLDTSFRPDMELVQGELKGKGMVSPLHGRVQFLIGHWFELHVQNWNLIASMEARTQVSGNSVRLPDVVLFHAGPIPPRAFTHPPLVAIEVLSPTDTWSDLKNRFDDLYRAGVKDIWLIDPDTQSAFVWTGDSLVEVHESQIQVTGSPGHLNLKWLWEKLDPIRDE